MASKTTLNAKNLQALGAERLAQLVLDVTKGNAEAKRRVRLELAGEAGVDVVIAAVRKRLAEIAKARSFVDWHKTKPLIADLTTQRSVITGQVASKDPAVAFDLLWEFLALTNRLYERVDDSSGKVQEVFHQVLQDIQDLAETASPPPENIADHIIAGLPHDEWNYYAPMIAHLGSHLGTAGVAKIKDYLKSPKAAKLDDYARQSALVNLTEAEGDIDAFIALQSQRDLQDPDVVAYIAEKLVADGRALDAWPYLEGVEFNSPYQNPTRWEMARLAALEAMNLNAEADEFRWDCFEDGLNPDHLKSILAKLPDFEDDEAEAKALEIAKAHEDVHLALQFLIKWKAHEAASDLVLSRRHAINGDFYQLLTPAANALDAKFPLAATLLRREMITFALETGRSSRYRHAARHLLECESAAHVIDDFAGGPDHETFVARLKQNHARKSSFWNAVAG